MKVSTPLKRSYSCVASKNLKSEGAYGEGSYTENYGDTSTVESIFTMADFIDPLHSRSA